MNPETPYQNPNPATPPAQPAVTPTQPATPPDQPLTPTAQPAAWASQSPTQQSQPVVISPQVFTPQSTVGDAAPVTSTPSHGAGQPFEYSSNPFKATSKGLALVLNNNPTSSLSVGLFALLFGIAGLMLAAVLTLVLPGAAGKIISITAGLVLFWFVLLRAIAATVQIYDKSMNGETITGLQALGSATNKGFGRFLWTLIIAGVLTLLASILLIIPGLIVAARLSMAPFIVYREHLSGLAAIKRSWQLSKGHTWEMLGAMIASAIVVGSSGGLLSLIGGESATANRYYELTEAEKRGTGTGKLHWLNIVTPIVVLLAVVGYFGFIIFIGTRLDSTYKSASSTSSLPSGLEAQPGYVSNQYCYYPTNTTSLNSNCVDETTCQANTDCNKQYFGSSAGDSSTDFDSSSGTFSN